MLQATSERDRATLTYDVRDVDPSVVRRIPESLAREFCAIAVGISNDRLLVAFAEEPSAVALARIERATGLRPKAGRAAADQIQRALARAYGRAETALPGHEAPAVRALDELHQRALLEQCSDIHIEPGPHGSRVRFRVDGILHEANRWNEPLSAAIVARIKLLAGMDIAERRMAQDGRYSLTVRGTAIDARISTVPAMHGENVVIRLLDRLVRRPSWAELGMSPDVAACVSDALAMASGFVIVCGPAGSGKSTTLYAALRSVDTESRAVCTVEDPVEQSIDGITQVQVNPRAGATFDAILRAHLRQDSNVIMLGETRDAETAGTAVAAALSGQLVLTTLHSPDAPRSIVRMSELGVLRTSIAAALELVVAQRLVRRLCVHCSVPAQLRSSSARRLDIPAGTEIREPRGCGRCGNSGYRERVGVFEAMGVSEQLREAIVAGAGTAHLRKIAQSGGYRELHTDCFGKVLSGITSIAEYERVAAPRAAS
jgi:type IV pilus assembly protein PilB